MQISKIFDNFVDYSSYDNLRKICSYIDGLKATSRKVIYVIRQLNDKELLKVNRMSLKIAEQTNYNHGETSIETVIINLASRYIGGNTINLIRGKGSYGTRLEPVPSASRYIFTGKNKILDLLFIKEDDDILINQYYEGQKIEYKYFLPTFPLILLNGSGVNVSVGFKQEIFPRNPIDVINYIENKIKNKNHEVNLNPYFHNWNGEVENLGNNKYIFKGKYKKYKKSIEITELPLNFTQKKYKKHLNYLEENGIITSYKDLCDVKNDKFNFKIRFKGENFDIENLKLETKVTELFDCVDENNKLTKFNNLEELLDRFIVIKIKSIRERKKVQLNNIYYELTLLVSKLRFVQNVINGKIIINKKKKSEIINRIEEFDSIIMKDGNYNYLLNMPLYSLSYEKINQIKNAISRKKDEYKKLKNKKVIDIYYDELQSLKYHFKHKEYIKNYNYYLEDDSNNN